MKAELRFILDEVGVSEWEGRKDKKVIVPTVLSYHTIHHRACGNLKHMSVMTWISAAGESLTPYGVISQDFECLRRTPMIPGVRLGLDFVLRQRSKPYVSPFLFLEYVNNILSIPSTGYGSPNK
jgi:hypothetical protein